MKKHSIHQSFLSDLCSTIPVWTLRTLQ